MGTYTDSLGNYGAEDGVYTAAAEQHGTFTMHMERVGYSPLDLNNIVVAGGECHVVTTVLNVTLAPVP